MKLGRALIFTCGLCMATIWAASKVPTWAIPILVCLMFYASYRYGGSRWSG